MNTTHLVMGSVLYGVHYPVAVAYVYWTLKGLPDAEKAAVADALKPRMRLLLAVWLAVLAASAAALIYTQGSPDVVKSFGFSAIVGFHVIWWPFVVPVFRRAEQVLQSRGLERSSVNAAPVRTAALKPRRASDYLTGWMRLLPAELGFFGVLVLWWRLMAHPPTQPRIWFMVITFAGSALFFLIAWSAWVRREVSTSYLADGTAEAAPDALKSAEALRRFRIYIIHWMQLIGALFFFFAAILCVELDRGAISERTLGIIGGVGGSLIGLAGGVLGMIAGTWAHRVRRQGIAM